MEITEEPESVVRMSPDELKIFLHQRTLTVALPGGDVLDEYARRRYAFFEVNYLHLNHGKGFWTWFADIYAVGLVILACTGIFIITGKKGLGGRGRWLLIIGLAIPLIYLVLAWVFASYGWPLVVMAVIPFGVVGALIGHWVMGLDITILSLFGVAVPGHMTGKVLDIQHPEPAASATGAPG